MAEKKPKAQKKPFLQRVFPAKGDTFGEGARKVLFLAALLTFFVSAGILLNELYLLPASVDKQANDMKQIYEGSSEPSGTASQAPALDEQGRLLKFKSLLDINPDVKGWITIPNTKVDYPVLQSSKEDSQYYLYRDINKASTKYGSLFLDANCSVEKDSPTQNLIIYGHHMQDGRMFANILEYTDLNFYKTNPVITFDTIYGESKWKVFAIFKTGTPESAPDAFNYLRPSFSNESDFLNFVYQIRNRSYINTPVDIRPDDQILTLSTCTYELNDYRGVVVARKVRPGEDAAVDVNAAQQNSQIVFPADWYKRYGGSMPDLPKTFEEAVTQGLVGWYKPTDDAQQ